MLFSFEKKLREKNGRRAIVVVGIVNEVRVELELAIVEVEVRRVVELTISVRYIAFVRQYHWTVRFTVHTDL